MSRSAAILRIAVAGCVVLLASGCGGGSDESSGLGGIPGGALQGSGPGDSDDANDACALLSDDDIAAAIGDHYSGEQDFTYGGCVWRAADDGTTAPEAAIYAAIVPPDIYTQVADKNTVAATDFAPGATYSDSRGELWWPCHTDQYCLVRAEISDAAERKDVVTQLGGIVRDGQ